MMKSLVVWLLGICALSTMMYAQPDKNGRFSVAMSIEMTTFSDPYTRDPAAISKASPDGRSFAIVTTKGSLASNRLESRLLVYSSNEIKQYIHESDTQAPRPRLLFASSRVPQALQSNSYGSLITGVQWTSDSQSILALIEMPHGYRHLFRICSVCHLPPKDLTPDPSIDVQTFSEFSGTIAYVVDTQIAFHQVGLVGEQINARATALTGTTLFHFLDPSSSPDRDNNGPFYELWINRGGQKWKVLGGNGKYYPTGASAFRLSFSPDGQFLIATQPVKEVPELWSQYKSSFTILSYQPDAIQKIDPSGRSRYWPWQYSLVDLKKKSSRALVDAPSSFLSNVSDAFVAAWSKDQKRILVTGTYLPLVPPSPPSGVDLRQPCAVAIFDVGLNKSSCITSTRSPHEYLRTAEFTSSDHEVSLRWLKDGKQHTELYRESENRWTLQNKSEDDRQTGEVVLSLRQDLGTRPTLWAADETKPTGKLLWDPNPQLAKLRFGSAKVYRWNDDGGYPWKGGLVLPPDYVEGQRYPLVIQTHGFHNEQEFLVDGSFTTGFAAQALAAEGMIVLQVGDRADRFTLPPTDEAKVEVAGFKSAIEHLNADGLIDVARVGIIGFSRTQWYVEQALIDCPSCFRAATLIDGLDQSYLSDVLFAPHMGSFSIESEAANGGKPFAAGLKQWMEHAPGFNLSKVTTPLRVEAIGKMSVLGEWEIYSLLTQQNKPVDLIYLPDGQHILQAPLDRYASQQGNVDWFRFWLKDESPSRDGKECKRWSVFNKQMQDKAM